ncbi:hypothetical protein [Streptomyces buecherae]|nr:hypothetical protein [Streptomyces buecherae]
MPHQMIYLGHHRGALGLLQVAATQANQPATKALVTSQTGRVHAALGEDEMAAAISTRRTRYWPRGWVMFRTG